ncbi:DUF1254 domain-containing protein [Limnohabitans sp. Rim11]|uniref:DUF1254 domain-containing protein n=1 Tax=Limnohabitans sp. Rim11 TaxID=1100719 RepID=UPI000A400DD6|nr:DUF1254 domain-containing protein [Limnohabitans sp. Rim11]
MSQTTRPLMRLAWIVSSAILACALLTLYALKDKILLGAETYVYGYPLVIMDITRAQSAAHIGPENQLRRVRQFPDASFKDVVRPNVDTLYTTAFLSMKQGPWIFEMPVQSERYELMPFMDAWTNVFATPGTRTRKGNESIYLLVGPNWQGTVPAHMTLFRSPTDMVWLIGRTQTNGVADFETVHRLQNGLKLYSFKHNQTAEEPASQEKSKLSAQGLPPVAQMKALSTAAFFEKLFQLMVDNPPATEDAPLLTRLAHAGLQPGPDVQLSRLDELSFSIGRWLANQKIKNALSAKNTDGTWRTPPLNLGQYSTDYNTRAVVAMVGLGANLPEDALYPNTASDEQGQPLNGKHKYRIHFAANQLPPVNAFWSLTAYGQDDFLVRNALNRFALGDRDPLHFNADGSLDIWIQDSAPKEPHRMSNWLPIQKDQNFSLNARLYWPKPAALSGTWQMPKVVRLED